jgi:uncharacterized membrane protein
VTATGRSQATAQDVDWEASARAFGLRAIGSYEKGMDYYLHNHLFLTKMGLLALILILEIGAM